MKLIPTLVVALSLSALPAAFAQSCCAEKNANQNATCPMADQTSAVGSQCPALAATTGHVKHVLSQPAQSVFDNYIEIQGALAQDSTAAVAAKASDIAKIIRGDARKLFSAKVAEQAQALAQAKDLQSARAAFKPLSESLIAFLKEQKVPAGTYYVAHCPMAKASWVQTGKTIANPYMGKGMLRCGEIQS